MKKILKMILIGKILIFLTNQKIILVLIQMKNRKIANKIELTILFKVK